MKIQNELYSIIQALRSFPAGASLEELNEALFLSLEKRTLQRRLKKLKENNLIRTEGGSHTTRYFIKTIDSFAVTKEKVEVDHGTIPLSQEGANIQTWISNSASSIGKRNDPRRTCSKMRYKQKIHF